ncbi:MAG TPA: NUDIX domain-containing protein [Candidatus Paceibacterota bacterium]|nr:NUDIX domain-containing protein [Candidatus Paceibacterota bacterium]
MKKTESAGGIILNVRQEIALVTNGPGDWWGFPKGHIDPGEDAFTAALREIEEETGLSELQYMRDLGFYERYRATPGGGDDTSELKKIFMFLFSTTQEELVPQDSFNPQAMWATPDEVVKLLNHGRDREFFEATRKLLSL